MNISASLENIAAFARGAFYATDNPAFNCIYEDLNIVIGCLDDNKSSLATHDKQASLHGFGIPRRIINGLKCEGIVTLNKLLECSELEIIKIPSIGLRSVKKIKECLDRHQLKLKGSGQ